MLTVYSDSRCPLVAVPVLVQVRDAIDKYAPGWSTPNEAW